MTIYYIWLIIDMILIFLLIDKPLNSNEQKYITTYSVNSVICFQSSHSTRALSGLVVVPFHRASCLLSFCTSSRGSCLKPGDLPSLVPVCYVMTRRRICRRICRRTCGAALQTSLVPGGRLPGISGRTLLSVSFDICHSIR